MNEAQTARAKSLGDSFAQIALKKIIKYLTTKPNARSWLR